MASEAKQENNRSDPDVVRLGPKFAPGTWFWQEAPARTWGLSLIHI